MEFLTFAQTAIEPAAPSSMTTMLMGAIGTLSIVVGYLYKLMNQRQEDQEKRLRVDLDKCKEDHEAARTVQTQTNEKLTCIREELAGVKARVEERNEIKDSLTELTMVVTKSLQMVHSSNHEGNINDLSGESAESG